jgi:hypothetical protein
MRGKGASPRPSYDLHQASVPSGFELGAADLLPAARGLIGDADSLRADMGDENEIAVAEGNDGRKLGMRQIFPLRHAPLPIQAEFRGAAQHIGNADLRGSAYGTDLLRFGSDPATSYNATAHTYTLVLSGASSVSDAAFAAALDQVQYNDTSTNRKRSSGRTDARA